MNICYGLDSCTDGTREWVENIKQSDPYVYSIENTGQDRVGLTVMYNRIVNELVMTDLAMLFHADMYLCPGALDEVEKLMYDTNSSARNLKRIVSLTRIEPALHPEGAEKIVKEYGMEPENFNEEYLLKFVEGKRSENLPETNGVFAPWAFWTNEFKEIGGHDLLFAPSSKEDSDIFNRFKNINYYISRQEDGYDEVGRLSSVNMAKNIDERILSFLDEFYIDYKTIPRNFDSAELVTKDIMEKL